MVGLGRHPTPHLTPNKQPMKGTRAELQNSTSRDQFVRGGKGGESFFFSGRRGERLFFLVWHQEKVVVVAIVMYIWKGGARQSPSWKGRAGRTDDTTGLPNHQRVECAKKLEARSEHAHVAYARFLFARFGRRLACSVGALSTKISACGARSEVYQECVVGWVCLTSRYKLTYFSLSL